VASNGWWHRQTAAVPIAVGWADCRGNGGKYDGDVLSLFDSNEDFDLDLAVGSCPSDSWMKDGIFLDRPASQPCRREPTAGARLLLATESFGASKVG